MKIDKFRIYSSHKSLEKNDNGSLKKIDFEKKVVFFLKTRSKFGFKKQKFGQKQQVKLLLIAIQFHPQQ